ncbi:hypothetical protein ESZ50_04870 [Weissella muntiaci]|uniref:Uncharacterized protein n=1 Tax=Weissella muntiaci TaxID=2508881 RepID=A0A6C2CA51_9LACO|nr:hypothetical protein [Weissella muntiaci]TYC49925.1 hypothetical protein ESZ50_04870 [Weissella muntiaci]
MTFDKVEKLDGLVPFAVALQVVNDKDKVGTFDIRGESSTGIILGQVAAEEREYIDRTNLENPEDWKEVFGSVESPNKSAKLHKLYTYDQVKELIEALSNEG